MHLFTHTAECSYVKAHVCQNGSGANVMHEHGYEIVFACIIQDQNNNNVRISLSKQQCSDTLVGTKR